MQSRRNFIGRVATGIAGTLATSNVLGANDRIRIGIIGPGARGMEILHEALNCPNIECVGAADVYTRRLEDAKKMFPRPRHTSIYRRLLDDKSIDAVSSPRRSICTPSSSRRARGRQARVSGKDDGVHAWIRPSACARRIRKTAASTWSRSAIRRCSFGHVADAHSSWRSAGDRWGKITAIDAQCIATRRMAKPQWARPRVSGRESGERRVAERSWATRPQREFDANRFIHWRYLLGLLGRQRVREHEPAVELLVQGAESADSAMPPP